MKRKKNGKTPKSSKAKKGTNKRQCFHCNQEKNYKRNCPRNLAKKKDDKTVQGKYDLLVVETCLVKYDTST